MASKHLMKVFRYGGDGIDNLRCAEIPVPTLGPGQVLVRVHATSLNYKDILVARGVPPRNPAVPLVPLSDAAGQVIEVGSGVTRARAGDRVATIVAQSWIGGPMTPQVSQAVLGSSIDGVLAEYVVLNQEGVVHIPTHLSYEEAATLPCAAATAWNALVRFGHVKAGDTILVQGSGGVSTFALQFAMLLGARVIAISSSDEKLEKMLALGAFAGINYRSMIEWDQEVLRLTGGDGVDHIVEVGGAGTLERSFRAIRTGGSISFIGVLAGLAGSVDPLPVLLKGLQLQGQSVGPRDVFEEMNRAIEHHSMRPVISRMFAFEQAVDALKYLETGTQFGKVVIQM